MIWSVFDMLDKDERVRVIVVTGKGKMFCAGADLERGSGVLERIEGEDNEEHRDGVALAIHRCRKPTIAAIQGSAVGVGITMTLPMTIRIVYTGAKVGFVFSQRGVIMEAASSFFLPRLVGFSRALYLTTTGLVLPASSPHFGPLFQELLPSSSAVLPRALELASHIATCTSTVSTYLMRELMWRGLSSAEEMHLLDSKIMWELYGKGDKKEGIEAFLEKREPRFGALREGLPDGDLGRGEGRWWDLIDTRTKREREKL